MSSLRSQYRHSKLHVQVQLRAVQNAGCVLLRSLPTPWLTPRLILEDPRQLLGFPATRSPQDFLSILSVSWISIAWICMIWYNCSCVISFHIDKTVPRERGCKVEMDSSAQQPWTCRVLYLVRPVSPLYTALQFPGGVSEGQTKVCMPANKSASPPHQASSHHLLCIQLALSNDHEGALRPRSLQ